MTRRLRIGVARLSHETNARSPLPTTLADFDRCHRFAGAALAARLVPGAPEIDGYERDAELSGAARVARAHGVEVVPLTSALAVPGGRIPAADYDALERELLDAVRAAGPLDGVYVALHGALDVADRPGAETTLLRRLRAAMPPGARLAASFDLHAHLTPDKVDAVDLLFAYQTNPHRDLDDTGARSLAALAALIRGEIRPTTAFRVLPMVLGGGTTVDFSPAMFGVFRRLRSIQRRPEVVSAAALLCHPWTAHGSPCWTVLVTTNGDAAQADRLADQLADALWATRHAPPPEPASIAEALAAVRRSRIRRRLGPTAWIDTSDIVGAGAPGDHTGVLRALLTDAPDLRAALPLRDPRAVRELDGASVGDTVTVDVGGTWSDPGEHRVALHGCVVHRGDRVGYGRTATLDLGRLRVVLAESAPLAARPAFFTGAGVDLRALDVVVLKSLFLWFPSYLRYVRRHHLVRTSGPTDFDAILRGPFDHPVHPKDRIDDWRPHDRAVRGVARGARSG